MKADHGRSIAVFARWLVCALALAYVSLSAQAEKLPQWGTAGVTSNGGKSFSINPSGGDLRIPMKSPGGGWQPAGNYGVQNPATGETYRLAGDGQVFRSMPDGSTVKYPLHIEAPGPTLGDIIGGVAGMVGGPIGIVCSIACPYAIDWLTRSGGRRNPSTGALERTDPTICSTAPCFKYSYPPWSGGTRVYFSSAMDAAVWFVGDRTAHGFDIKAPVCDGSDQCTFTLNGSPGYASSPSKESTPPVPASWLPASMDDIAPYMHLNLPNVGIMGEILANGGDLPLPSGSTTTVTGPASIDGAEKSTVNPDGSRTVEKTTYNFSTSGNTVNNTSNVTNTTVYNADNSVRSVANTTTTPTEAVKAPGQTTTTASDAPQDPKDPCEGNPNRIGCIDIDVPTGTIDKSTKTITYAEESTFGGGSCPANKMWTPGTLGRTYTFIDWTKPCDWAASIRAIVLLCAAWAAFFIVMPGGTAKP